MGGRENLSRIVDDVRIVADLVLRKVGRGLISAVIISENSMSDGPMDAIHDRAKVENMRRLYTEDELNDRIDKEALRVGLQTGSYSTYIKTRERMHSEAV